MTKKINGIWTVLLVIFFLYLLYQSTFAWDDNQTSPKNIQKLPVEKTAFLMITDKHYGVQSSGIGKIQKSLEMWSFDNKRDKVLLKHSNLLPTDNTQMMVIYDKGNSSFESHSDVLSLINFPFEHYVDNEMIFDVSGVSPDGEIFMTYKNQRIHLSPGESYYTFSFEGFKVTKTTITNKGLYNKSQFDLQGSKDNENGEGKVQGPELINIDKLEKKPLEPPKESSVPEDFFGDETDN